MDRSEIKSLMHEVLNERVVKSGIQQEEHYLHHIWVRQQIEDTKDFRKQVNAAVIKFGVPTVLVFMAWAAWQGIKIKLGFRFNGGE